MVASSVYIKTTMGSTVCFNVLGTGINWCSRCCRFKEPVIRNGEPVSIVLFSRPIVYLQLRHSTLKSLFI
ncbi:hypothetical protein XELAEV_18037425mg [Xenopus laevis]|uniref:Uncharacterized protein n=1 Tax=Xenopus laevis TaxID=8355 RepID=A0A974HA61_XENLA|nr:hypothetical protein XELAEV_18037425mg [Xenopus laevis]